jgi:two-component system LytT family sensor kinase
MGEIRSATVGSEVTPRVRAWLLYVAAWVPVAAIYALAIGQTRGMRLVDSLTSGLTYVLVPAAMGVAIWSLSGRLGASRRPVVFIATHGVLAVVFSLVWLVSQIGLIALGTGWTLALEVGKTFATFQAVTGLWLYGMLAGASYAIRAGVRLRAEEARATRADALRVRAELAALRGQLNPHFLFNTLHTLTALVRRDAATAEQSLERFGDMLRYVLDVKRAAREDVSLAEEMQFVRNYLSLEQLRFGERLRVREDIDPDAYDCVLPSLTLQPLIENAIKYGVAPRAGGGTIDIRATTDGDRLSLEVRDDGQGSSAEALAAATGMGLRAVRQRLETRYGRRTTFDVRTSPGAGFAVHVSLPAHTGVGAEHGTVPA